MVKQQLLPTTDLNEYSSSSTLIHFNNPIPLLRGPIPAGSSDDPSSGPFLLAFENPQSWAFAYKFSKSQITQQCETGSRIGCSIFASNKCRPPWWKSVTGVSKQDFKERQRCEEREMAKCVEDSKVKCCDLAEEKCLSAFTDARIKCDYACGVTNYRGSELLESNYKGIEDFVEGRKK